MDDTCRVSGTCRCGVFAAAVCLRCQSLTCAVHYYVKVFEFNRLWYAETPSKTVDLNFDHLYHLDEAIEAFAKGGPSCCWCREQSAMESIQSESAKTRALVSRFVNEPSIATLLPLRSATLLDVVVDEEAKAVLAQVFNVMPAKMLLASVAMGSQGFKERPYIDEMLHEADVIQFQDELGLNPPIEELRRTSSYVLLRTGAVFECGVQLMKTRMKVVLTTDVDKPSYFYSHGASGWGQNEMASGWYVRNTVHTRAKRRLSFCLNLLLRHR